MTNWQELRIGDLGSVVTGKTPPTSKPEFYGSETPFLTPRDMDGCRKIDKTQRYLSKEGVTKVRSSLIPKGSVSVSCIGSMGKAVLTCSDTVTNQQINSVVVNPTFDNLFVYYNLSGRKAEIQFLASGSVQPIMNKTDFSNLPIKVPNLQTQKAIASVLGALDDKIENNRRMNETLEEMARVIFKSWFVDFDPVHAKAEGKQPVHMDAETAALFPSTFGDHGLPEGWAGKKIENVMEFAYGKALKASDRIEGEVPVYGSGGITGSHNVPLVEGPSVIIGRKGTVGSLYWEDRPFFPIDTTFYLKPKSDLAFFFYLLQTLKLDNMNTDAAVPGLNRNNVYRLEFTMPSDNCLMAFGEFVGLLREKIRSNREEIQTLATLRDTLLPKLMNGEIRIKDAEQEVGAIA